ncbi:MAG: replication-associated recombination protein A [Chloroflexi bacterium]|nr:replication-associated recombination protein A [Chloroflexota bacterium]
MKPTPRTSQPPVQRSFLTAPEAAAIEHRVLADAPLAVRMRPQHLDEFVGQQHLLGPGKPLRRAVEQDRLGSIILWGPPGTGKTTFALLAARLTRAHFASLSAVTDGVADLRRVIDEAKRCRRAGERTVLLVDEVHRWSKAQQDALLPYVEDGTITLIGATTENPYFDVIAPLRSRVRIFRFEPLDDESLRHLIRHAVEDERGLGGRGLSVDPEAVDELVAISGGDARIALNALEAAAGEGSKTITSGMVREAVQRRQVRYDRAGDDHYQTISAFIKSLRGSDPDAAVFYLAKMLAAGEDPRFVARRMVILASEDVGNADPQALLVATAAAQAVERIGLPEAGLNLAQAATYLATAPKSNRSAVALWRAQAAIEAGANTEVPLHLRNASFSGAKGLGYGRDYRYAHDHEGAYVTQRYLPEGVNERFYEPGDQGYEREIAERLRRWRMADG